PTVTSSGLGSFASTTTTNTAPRGSLHSRSTRGSVTIRLDDLRSVPARDTAFKNGVPENFVLDALTATAQVISKPDDYIVFVNHGGGVTGRFVWSWDILRGSPDHTREDTMLE